MITGLAVIFVGIAIAVELSAIGDALKELNKTLKEKK